MAPVVTRLRNCLEPAEITEPVSAVHLRITIQHFAPKTAFGYAHAVVITDHRRQIENDKHRIARRSSLPEVADDARLLVAVVHPLEPGVVEVEFIQRRLDAVKPVQIPHPLP